MLEISAILTTRNRASLLPIVLEGLKRQCLPSEYFEIVAIDDGSSDETAVILDRARAELPLRVLRQNHAGLAAAKNLGIFGSRAPIVVFLDDDDVADPRLLRAHVLAHKKYPEPEVAVLGYTELAPEVGKVPLMRHVTQVGCQLFSYGWIKPGMTLDYTCFWGGRSSCKRGLLVEHGIFNPVFGFGCEDIELGWRLAQSRFRVIYEPAAMATMIRTLGFKDFCGRSERQGRSQWRLAQLHPAPAVRKYCEIDEGLALWADNMGRFLEFLVWAEKLDRLANVREAAGRPLDARSQETLDQVYRTAFKLSRAKGIAQAAHDQVDDGNAEHGMLERCRFGYERRRPGASVPS